MDCLNTSAVIGLSYYILIDDEDKCVLRNRRFLRSLKESGPSGEYGVYEDDHVVDPEQLSTGPAVQADAIIKLGSSPPNSGAPCRRSNEVIGRQRSVGKPTEVGREQPLPAARHAQASPECYMQPASHPSHTYTNSHTGYTGRITRSKTRLEKGQKVKKVSFALKNNTYFEF